jgi:hypothetical protein
VHAPLFQLLLWCHPSPAPALMALLKTGEITEVARAVSTYPKDQRN